MSSGFYTWSQTASSNASADASINWAEGQAPSSINDSARAMMAATAKYRDDIAGAIVTGGTSTAYTVTSYQVFDTLAHLNGQMVAFTPNATSTNAVGVDVTLNVDGLGAKPVRMQPSVALPGGTLILGTPYVVLYNNSDGAFYLQNTINPYVIPISSGFDYWGPTAPNSCFAFPIGQAISRTTYASLFSGNNWSIGTTYGSGDGSTTFNLPDKRERVSVMKTSAASRLTSTYFGGDSTALGATGGGESTTLTLGQLPTGITSAPGSAWNVLGSSNNALSFMTSNSQSAQYSANAGSQVWNAISNAATVLTQAATATGTVTSNNTSGNPHRTVPPTIVCNYILRIC